jgi:hypothetical protein
MKSVVVCGSKRYKDEIRLFCDELESAGVVVFRPNIDEPMFEGDSIGSAHLTRMIFKGLTLEHFEMIRKADVCFIYNKGGYVGASVTLELGFSQAMGMSIYALEEQLGDPCKDCLIDGVVPTAKALVQKCL